MHRSKIIKKRTKNRETLLRNLRKGKARLEDRAAFQLIPYPTKFSMVPQIYRLYADLVLMEQNGTMISEISLCNNFKYYKNAQIVDGASQKIIKYQVENKVNTPPEDWRPLVENLENSDDSSMKQWAGLIKDYSERYEAMMKDFQEEFSKEKFQALSEIGSKSEKARQNIFKTYPCVEIKSQLKDGHIQFTEISYSEKYLTELGYTIDEYTSQIFKEGLPLNVPLDEGASWIAKARLEKYLTTDPNGYQTPEFESCVVMKSGFLKKLKYKVHYYTCFEKGVPGFVIIGAIVARQKPSMNVYKPAEGIKVNPEFVDFMIKREKEQTEFLWEYYDVKAEQKYTNLHKVCKIKEVTAQESL